MKDFDRPDSDKSSKRAYTKPTATLLELQPEERLMLCGKKAGLPNDPCGGPFPSYVST